MTQHQLIPKPKIKPIVFGDQAQFQRDFLTSARECGELAALTLRLF